MRWGICQHGSVSWKLDLQKWTLYEKKVKEGDIWAHHIIWNETIMSQAVPYLNGWIFWGRGVIFFNINNLHCIWNFSENLSVLVGDVFPSNIIEILQMQDSSVGGVGWAGFWGKVWAGTSSPIRPACSYPARCPCMVCFGLVWFGMVWYGMV